MNDVIKLLDVIGVTYSVTEIELHLRDKTINETIKFYLDRENVKFYYSKNKKFVSMCNEEVYKKFGEFIEIDGFYAYEMWGVEFISEIVERGYCYVR
jgi:hypothetical protein